MCARARFVSSLLLFPLSFPAHPCTLSLPLPTSLALSCSLARPLPFILLSLPAHVLPSPTTQPSSLSRSRTRIQEFNDVSNELLQEAGEAAQQYQCRDLVHVAHHLALERQLACHLLMLKAVSCTCLLESRLLICTLARELVRVPYVSGTMFTLRVPLLRGMPAELPAKC